MKYYQDNKDNSVKLYSQLYQKLEDKLHCNINNHLYDEIGRYTYRPSKIHNMLHAILFEPLIRPLKCIFSSIEGYMHL